MARRTARNHVLSTRLSVAERREVVRAVRERLGRDASISDYLREAALAYARREVVVVVPESMEGAA